MTAAKVCPEEVTNLGQGGQGKQLSKLGKKGENNE